MCPNCVTPWKCNGPHIPQMSNDLSWQERIDLARTIAGLDRMEADLRKGAQMDSIKTIGIKALKTGVQTFIAVAGLSATSLYNLATVKSAAVAAAAAVLSVLQNAALVWAASKS